MFNLGNLRYSADFKLFKQNLLIKQNTQKINPVQQEKKIVVKLLKEEE